MDYVILRDISNARHLLERQSRDFLTGAMDTSRFSSIPTVSAGPAEFRIELETMSANDMRDLGRDPSVLGLALPMPTALIETTPQLNADTANPSWGIRAIKADISDFDGSGVSVAVLDTGIDASHETFTGMNLIEQDFTGSGNGDVKGHGTHCAGTIFGRDVNGRRIGVARGINEALIGKVLGDDGRGSSTMLFDAMNWAAQSGADVISMSLGFDFPALVDQLINEEGYPADLATSIALESYRANFSMFVSILNLLKASEPFGRASIVVAAAGNGSHRDIDPNYQVGVSLPGAAQDVISVGALSSGNTGYALAPFSNSGPVLCAPGVDVVSAQSGGDLVALSGTSMACPHVAGCCALWWQAVGTMAIPRTIGTVTARILAATTAAPLVHGTDIVDRGLGIVQAP